MSGNRLSDAHIPLYTEQGTATDYHLIVDKAEKKTYYLAKTVPTPDSHFSDKTKYMAIVIKRVEDPVNIVVNNTQMFINAAYLKLY